MFQLRHPRSALLASCVYGVLAAAAAQATPQQDSSAQSAIETVQLEEVMVTGSRIKRASGFDYPVPVAVVGGEAVTQSGFTVLGDVMQNLPQSGISTNIQSTSGTLFNSGQSRVDLRALGSARTLVLVDGRRHLTGDFRTSAVDLNMIPSSMVDRIEAISGGASAVYGSEAIAGVVNVILRKNIDGLELDLQGGQSRYDDGEEWKVALAYGTKFGEGRGRFVIGAEYADVNPIMQIDRDWAFPGIRRNNLVTPQTSIPASRSNVMPTATFQLVNSTNPATARSVSIALDRSTINANTADCRTSTVRATCQDPWLFYTATYNALQGSLERHSTRAYADYQLTDSMNVFADVTYAVVDGYGIFQPAFSNAAGGGTMPVRLYGDNAYLNGSSALAAQLRSHWTGAGLTLTNASNAFVGKFWSEFGGRDSKIYREQIRGIVGIEGDFSALGRDFSYETYAQYSELNGYAIGYNVPNIARVQQATDAVLVGGQVVCRSAAAQAAGCVPWDLINGPSAAAVEWANADARSDGEASQLVIAANLSTELFQLPAGPVGFAIGAEYRDEKSDQIQDALSASGALFYNAIGRTQGGYDITEAYAEVAVPLLRDLPFIHRLSVELAGRVGDYSSVGRVSQWRAAAEWAPVEDVRFRVSQAVSVRAPNITELYAPQGRNFTTAANDPCDRAQIASLAATDPRRAIRIANCSAVIPGYDPLTFNSNFGSGRPSLPLLQGGNPDLFEESADTFTAGVVIRPRFVEGLQLSVDYWNIKVDDAVSTIPINTLLQNLCYDQAQTPAHSNRFCQLVVRDPTGTSGGAVPGGVIEVILTNQNVQSIETTGLDVAIAYDFSIGRFGKLGLQLDGTRMTQWDLQGIPGGIVTEYFNVLGTPEYRANGALTWALGDFTASWQTRWLSSMKISELESPATRDPFFTGNYYEHDFRVGYKFNDNLSARFGIINLTDEHPPETPETLAGTSATSSAYDNRGRWYYAGVGYKF